MLTVTLTPADSINSAIANLTQPATILLTRGVYCEKVLIDKPNVTIIGLSPADTVIAFDDCANKIHSDGKEFNTFRTYTLMVNAPNVTLKNLSVVNKTQNPAELGQAVALHVYGDNFHAANCEFASTQDTVFNGPLPSELITRYIGFLPDCQRNYKTQFRQFFHKCVIKGSVDFIFGCGDVIYYDCDVVSVPDGRKVGYVCAPAHELSQTSGISFVDCRFINGGVLPNSIFLARPWRDYGIATFVNCLMDNHISSAAFDKWNDTRRDLTARFAYSNCSLTSPVSWAKLLSKEQVDQLYFQISKYLNE